MRIFLVLLILLTGISGRAQMYGLIDSRAERAPAFETPAELVTYLTHDLQDDKSKARALAAWIAFQVQRDGYRHKELIKYSNMNRVAPPALNNNSFKTRIGTPFDFARLFQELGSLAGLTVATIQGYAGYDIPTFRYDDSAFQAGEVLLQFWQDTKFPLQRYEAAWNAVQIEGEWYLLDTYWMIANRNMYAAERLSTERAMKRFLAQREKRLPARFLLTQGKEINNDYFFAKPRFFVKTHFPLDPEWQLLPVPLTWSSFTTN